MPHDNVQDLQRSAGRQSSPRKRRGGRAAIGLTSTDPGFAICSVRAASWVVCPAAVGGFRERCRAQPSKFVAGEAVPEHEEGDARDSRRVWERLLDAYPTCQAENKEDQQSSAGRYPAFLTTRTFHAIIPPKGEEPTTICAGDDSSLCHELVRSAGMSGARRSTRPWWSENHFVP
jgi:hypothetical protein